MFGKRLGRIGYCGLEEFWSWTLLAARSTEAAWAKPPGLVAVVLTHAEDVVKHDDAWGWFGNCWRSKIRGIRPRGVGMRTSSMVVLVQLAAGCRPRPDSTLATTIQPRGT